MTQTRAFALINDPRLSPTSSELDEACAVLFRAEFPTIESYIVAHPVGQDFHSGKYGFRRYAGALNLNACVFPTRRAAETAREKTYRECSLTRAE